MLGRRLAGDGRGGDCADTDGHLDGQFSTWLALGAVARTLRAGCVRIRMQRWRDTYPLLSPTSDHSPPYVILVVAFVRVFLGDTMAQRILLMAILFLGSSLFAGCTGKHTFQRLSWNEQVRYATEAARNVDPQAVLTRVQAYPYNFTDLHGSFVVTFIFSRPHGFNTEITFQDDGVYVSPTVVPENGGYKVDVQVEDIRRQYRAALDYVHISSSDAVQASLAEGQRFSQSRNQLVNPSVALWADDVVMEYVGVPAIWIVTYHATGERYVSIDAQTGQVLQMGDTIASLFPGLPAAP